MAYVRVQNKLAQHKLNKGPNSQLAIPKTTNSCNAKK